MVIETKVKSGGSWRDITAPQVKLSGTWRTITDIEVKFGGVWRKVFESVSPPVVTVAPTRTISNFRLNALCKARVKVDNDGDLYSSNNLGTIYTSYETWLDSGTNDQVWVQRTIISGSLDLDAGTTRLACTSDRIWGNERTLQGVKTTVIDLKWYDAAAGGNLLDTQRVTLVSEFGGL